MRDRLYQWKKDMVSSERRLGPALAQANPKDVISSGCQSGYYEVKFLQWIFLAPGRESHGGSSAHLVNQ